jgi:hypothetical protein
MGNKENWLRAVGKFLLWLGEKVVDISRFCLGKLLAEDVSFNFQTAFLLLLVSTIMIGSGSWAASIALSRRHSGWLHFLLGALMPGVYPFVLMFTMGLKGERERKKKIESERLEQEKEEEERQRVRGLLRMQEGEETDAEEDEDSFNARYFERIARDAEGNKAGPWKVVFAGMDIIVQEIIEVQEDFVLVIMSGREGKNEKLRIPYSKIGSWEDYIPAE